MDFIAIVSFMFLGLGLGALHAFDPDHVAAVGGLSTHGRQYPAWQFSLQWSLGHGAALVLVAVLVFIAGHEAPAKLSAIAEKSVGLVLVAIGVMALLRISHAYFRVETEAWSQRRLASPLVGLLHGTAGSAPLLALIPLAQLSRPIVGVLYVVFFSLGVLTAMTVFGAMLALGFRRLNQFDALWLSLVQAGLATFSLTFGLYLIIASH